MLTINMKSGNRRLGTPQENLSTPLHLIDSIDLSGHELAVVAQAAFSPIPYSRKTLDAMLDNEMGATVTSPSSIQQALDILRERSLPPKPSPEDGEDWNAMSSLDQALERTRTAMKILAQARDTLITMQPSRDQKRIVEACQKLGAKGYSIERILGILDAEGRPALDVMTGETRRTEDSVTLNLL